LLRRNACIADRWGEIRRDIVEAMRAARPTIGGGGAKLLWGERPEEILVKILPPAAASAVISAINIGDGRSVSGVFFNRRVRSVSAAGHTRR
jgi:hypothetical protein